ncbi:hypothetical protein ACFX11_019520 [Malus domestica]
MLAKKKRKTSSTTREGSPVTLMFMIDLTSSNDEKDEATRSEPVTPAISKMASLIVDMIAQRRGSVVPQVPKLVPKHSLGDKSVSPLERLANIKSDKVDYAAKVVPMLTPLLLRLIRLLGRRKLLTWAAVRNPLSLLLGRMLRSVRF